MKINFQNLKYKRNKGFTLVELIVVLVILAILAAILVPALLGYIDRAKNHQYIVEARDLMVASEVAIMEAYAKEGESFEYSLRTNTSSPYKKDYGYYTSDILYDAKNGTFLTPSETPGKEVGQERGAAAKNVMSRLILKYVEKQNYDFYKNGYLKNNQSVADFKGKVAFMIMYGRRGRIVYMQYSRDGKLVTFDGTDFTIQDGGNFATVFRN